MTRASAPRTQAPAVASTLAARHKEKGPGVAGVCPHPRHRASARCGRALFARHCHQLLGRLLQCDHAYAGRHALPRHGAGGIGASEAFESNTQDEHGPLGRPAKPSVTQRLDALVDIAVGDYAPVTRPMPDSNLVRRLRFAVPQWQAGTEGRMLRVKATALAHTRVDGVDWYWPAGKIPRPLKPG